MLTNIQIPLVLPLLGLMAISAVVAHADTPPPAGQTLTAVEVMNQFPGVIYRKVLPDGRTLSVSRIKLPPDPKTIKSLDEFAKAVKATKGFPSAGTVLYPDYSWLYSFEVARGKAKPVTLWTLRADHIPSMNYTEIDWSEIRMRDAALEGQVLVLVFKQARDTYAFIILPDAKHSPQRLPRSGPSFCLAKDVDNLQGRVFTQTAQITGSFAQKTLGVDLTFTDGTKERFNWKGAAWVKDSTIPATGDTNPKSVVK
ncbi:MAG: hypothetical protein ACRYFS_20195 [Janthinobacterium lividum]